MTMKKRMIPAGEFKAKCLSLLDQVAHTGQGLVVTKRGRPVAEVVPIQSVPSLRGSVLHQADLVSPVDDTWNADH